MGLTSSRAPILAEQARHPCQAGALAEGLQGLGELRLGAGGWLSPSGQAAPRSACSHLGHSSQKAHVRQGLRGQEPWTQEASGGGPAGSGLVLSHVHPHLPLLVLGGERGQFQKECLGVGGGHGPGSRGDNKQTSRVVGHWPTPSLRHCCFWPWCRNSEAESSKVETSGGGSLPLPSQAPAPHPWVLSSAPSPGSPPAPPHLGSNLPLPATCCCRGSDPETPRRVSRSPQVGP